MNQAIAHIDISTASGRRLVKELEKHKEVVKVEYLLPEELSGQKLYTVDEVFSKVEEKLNKHYGTNLKLKY
jgi:hypothetical protein